jgi:hypothetical protein
MNSLRILARNIFAAELGFTDAGNIRDVMVTKPNVLFTIDGTSVPLGQYIAGINQERTEVQLYPMDNPTAAFYVSAEALRALAKDATVKINEFGP